MQNETENEAPEEVPVDSCVCQQQLSRLNVRQLSDVSTHMDVSQQVLQHLESRCVFERHVINRKKSEDRVL